jgi:asparagine synthase (glutamine-hydrolysing)
VSDVPFGAFLSGGIDSSLVAYHMSRQLQEPVHTFTIGFDDASYDESERAATVARAIGSDHLRELVHVDKFDLLDDLLPKLARHYGEPFADSSAIPTYCVSAVARSRVKMVLSGDGGDELFAGYNTYPAILGALPAEPARRSWRSLLGGPARPAGDTLRARALGPPRREAVAAYGDVYAYFRDAQRRELYNGDVAAEIARHDHAALYAQAFADAPAGDCLSALQYLDLKTYLPGDILMKVDVASMYSSLEVRVPLLDHRVIEMAARVPPELKLFGPDGTVRQKYLLRRYAETVLPHDVVDQPKHGFGVPIDRWFSGELYAAVRDRLTTPHGVLARLFAPEPRLQLVETPAAAAANAPRIWALLFVEAWTRVYSPAL